MQYPSLTSFVTGSIAILIAALFIGPPIANINMPSLSAVRAANAAFKTSYTPVAVFVGGTSGIGQGVAESFARHTKGNAHIIIMGRNRAAADAILAKMPPPTGPGATHEFIQVDASLMKNVHAVSKELLTRVPRINFLVMSTGIMTMDGRVETEEGIDRKLAVHYYSRWRFIQDLLPALQKAHEAGEDAKVMSVLAAGKGGEIDLDDLGLKKTFSIQSAALQAPTYNDLMLEEFSARNPELTFIHAYPGFVRTGLHTASPSRLINIAGALATTLAYPLTVSHEECGEHMLYALLNNTKGVFRTGSKGEDLDKKRYFGTEAARKKLWEHTWESAKVE